MQPKFIFIAIAVLIGALLVFNMVNSPQSDSTGIDSDTPAVVTSETTTQADKKTDNTSIGAKPLSQQPKAMVDKANNVASQLEAAQQTQAEEMAQIDSN